MVQGGTIGVWWCNVVQSSMVSARGMISVRWC